MNDIVCTNDKKCLCDDCDPWGDGLSYERNPMVFSEETTREMLRMLAASLRETEEQLIKDKDSNEENNNDHYGSWVQIEDKVELTEEAKQLVKGMQGIHRYDNECKEPKRECAINLSTKENGFSVWCCDPHAQEYCDSKNNKNKKISKKDSNG